MSDDLRDGLADHLRVAAAVGEQLGLLVLIADRIIECFDTGGKLVVFGNGGSAADAQHIAAELVGRFKTDHRPLPAVALTTDTSVLTAVSNDFGFEHVFERQVEALVRPGDVAWALSVSGRSPSVLRALRRARVAGAATVGFTGRSGGAMSEHCDYCLRVDHDSSDRVQEVHQLAYHLICGRIEARFIR